MFKKKFLERRMYGCVRLSAQRKKKSKSIVLVQTTHTGHREAKNNTFRLQLGTNISCYMYPRIGGSMLALDSSNTGKYLAFDSLEEGTATGGDVGNLVGHTKLVDASYGIATSDEGESAVFGSLGNGFSNGL